MIYNRKILILGNSHLTVFGFRGELIKQLIKEGWEVTVAFPNGPFGEGEKTAEEYGCKFIQLDINRRGANPFEDLTLLQRYIKLIRRIKPSAVFAYTVKCDVYGGIACRILKVPFYPNITGIGKGLAEGGIVGKITAALYKVAVKKAKCIFFQNEADRRFFDEGGIRYEKSIMLPGSGVNLEKYVPLPYPDDSRIIFTYVARVMKAKGIEEFLDAARQIRQEYGNVEFHICGYCEEDYQERIRAEEKAGTVVYHGLVSNMIEIERFSHCIVLPSFHPEGISNVLLEAAASARPVITTDRPGCRETVNDRITGFLVRERDSHDLTDKMRRFLKMDNVQRENMGLAGRQKIEKEFDRQLVVNAYIEELRVLLNA